MASLSRNLASPDTKAMEVTRVLTELATQMAPGSKLPTVRDLRKQLQISQHTLDAALKTLEIRGLLSRKEGVGIYVSSLARIRRIGVVERRDSLEYERSTFSQLLMNSLRLEGSRRGHMVTSYTFDPEHDVNAHGPTQLDLDVQNGRVDGLVIIGLCVEHKDQLQALGVPCTFFSSGEPRHTPRVMWDLETLITEGVRALVRCGRRRIGMAYPDYPGNTIGFGVSLDLFQRVVRAEGATAEFGWLMPYDRGNVRVRALEASRQFHKLWASSAVRPDGLLSSDDQYTAGVLHAVELLGVRMPQDLVVVSHANKGMELFGEAKVIRLEYDSATMAEMLLQALDDLLAGRQPLPVQIVVPRLRWPTAGEAGWARDADKSQRKDLISVAPEVALKSIKPAGYRNAEEQERKAPGTVLADAGSRVRD